MRFAGSSAPAAAGCVGHFVIARAPAFTAAMNDELSAFVRPSLSLMLLVSAPANMRDLAVASDAGAAPSGRVGAPLLTSPPASAVAPARGASALALGLELHAAAPAMAAKSVNAAAWENGLEYITVKAR